MSICVQHALVSSILCSDEGWRPGITIKQILQETFEMLDNPNVSEIVVNAKLGKLSSACVLEV